MILTRKLLLLVLLCWPLVGFSAENEAPDVSAMAEKISKSETIDAAAQELTTQFTALAEYYKTNKNLDDEIVQNREKEIKEKIASAPTCNTETTTATTPATTAAQEQKDGRTEEEKKQALEEKQKAYDEAKANEQSLANRTLTAVTTAATGIGGMELAMGLAEQKADKNADESMAAYIETMRCTYGGKQVKAGAEEIELPGGNDQQLMDLRNEYFALAADLKERKTALGMKPGIESEEILDKASSGLYDDEFVGITSGAFESRYRAKMLESEADQQKLDAAAKASKNRVMGGAIAAGAGVLVGVGGNALINGELGKKIKEGIQSKKIGKETQSLLKAEANALKDLQKCLKSAGAQETDKLTFKQFYPSVLSVKNVKCDSFLIQKSGTAPKASEVFIDKLDETELFEHFTTYFTAENIGKLIGYNLTNNPSSDDITKAKAQLKKSIESAQQKFKDAEEKDKAEAEKQGVSIGNISGSVDGSGLESMSSLFSGVKDGGSFDLSSFIK